MGTVWDSNALQAAKPLRINQLQAAIELMMGWLGGRDSNPDNVGQSYFIGRFEGIAPPLNAYSVSLAATTTY